jgi:hypothetical protein
MLFDDNYFLIAVALPDVASPIANKCKIIRHTPKPIITCDSSSKSRATSSVLFDSNGTISSSLETIDEKENCLVPLRATRSVADDAAALVRSSYCG